MKIDVLYTARNRLEFVKVTFELLMQNTNWDLVNKLTVYDDGSTDGTKTWLERRVVHLNTTRYMDIELVHTELRSPPALMNHFLKSTAADVMAKVDSDIALPRGWLDAMVGVMEREDVELLGMEAGQTELAGRDGKVWDGIYRYTPSTHIGGVGLMQVERFRHLPPIREDGYFGWTEHQDLYRWTRGWITPDLLVPQLDRIPLEPWITFTDRYREKRWCRTWPPYEAQWSEPYWAWLSRYPIKRWLR